MTIGESRALSSTSQMYAETHIDNFVSYLHLLDPLLSRDRQELQGFLNPLHVYYELKAPHFFP
jgi:hypothetical protein